MGRITDTPSWVSPCSQEATDPARGPESCPAFCTRSPALHLQWAHTNYPQLFVTMSRDTHFPDLHTQKTCPVLTVFPNHSLWISSVALSVEWKRWSPFKGLGSVEPPTSPFPTLTPSHSANYLKATTAERSKVIQGLLWIYVHFRTHWPSSTSFMSQDQEGTINIVTTGLDAHSFPTEARYRALWLQTRNGYKS